ncbi:hypothetical protein [Vibrio rotiferianus]|uniref:hypothetical protein n=1 Tax=Vibrio rotiferianus TaxID=190895 RepID=UPI0003A0BF37|nr:hypothetical protein [Vibrio rotiferianus]PIB16904.1 hypothetical protein B853_08167 [Vibrio rotiferianus CAIM 577 = LMG 21460]
MNPEQIAKYQSAYHSYMTDIKHRIELADRVYIHGLQGKSFTGHIDTDLDLLYLQVRKVCETIMFSCVAANQASGKELNKKLTRTAYKPGEISRLLKQANGTLFPKAIKRKVVDGVHHIENHEDLESILDLVELEEVWNKSGDFLHSKRVNKASVEARKSAIKVASDFLIKTKNLLNEHWIVIDESYQFGVIMNRAQTNDVQVMLMKAVEEPET